MMSNYCEGDRIIAPGDKFGTVSSVHRKITITWDNGLSAEYTPKQLQAWNYRKFLSTTHYVKEEKGAMSTTTSKENAQCLDTPASLQESPALNSELKQPEQLTSSPQDYSSKTTPKRKQSLNADIQKSPFTAISGTITLSRESSTFTQLDFLVPEHQLQETEQDLNTQNHHSGLSPCAALPMAAPASSSLKILKGLSIEDYEQFLGDSEWSAIVGTIRSSYRRRKSDHRKDVTDSSLLPTPTTYAKGSTGCRPAGQTRLEQKLKPYLTKGDKLNPGVPGWMMGFPVGWVEKVLMDGGQATHIQLPFTQEYVTIQTNDENVTTSTPVQSALSKQRSQLEESVTSPISPITKNSNLPMECTQQIQDVHCPSCESPLLKLEDGCGVCGWTPVNFLEESQPQPEAVQKSKGRQRKGCLYKYLENKKLKSGAIASYPRVIGNRKPDNPTHWRWGFNWEEKIDGEWKGRSIGSIPVGAIAMIQSMQKKGVPLEEIIGFIRRAKVKK